MTRSPKGKPNFNICTYVMAISRKPKLYAIALQSNTLSCDNLLGSEMAVLMHLHTDHSQWISRLGKKSGRSYDKFRSLKRQNQLDQWKSHPVIKGCLSYVELQKTNVETTGDHHLFTFKVSGYSTRLEGSGLTYDHLVKQGLIL